MSCRWQIVAAWIAIGVGPASCWGDRPLRRPRDRDAGQTTEAKDAVAPKDLVVVTEAPVTPEAPVAIDAAEAPAESDACGGDGQRCCEQGCNPGLACDRAADASRGTCTSRCGLRDGACCRGGACESGTSCDTQDDTGTCKACGLPGLLCCRGDCWIGVCAYTDAPRYCLACGRVGQPCCGDPYNTSAQCQDGAVCKQASANDRRGTCGGS
jgi:hypothetical protein